MGEAIKNEVEKKMSLFPFLNSQKCQNFRCNELFQINEHPRKLSLFILSDHECMNLDSSVY